MNTSLPLRWAGVSFFAWGFFSGSGGSGTISRSMPGENNISSIARTPEDEDKHEDEDEDEEEGDDEDKDKGNMPIRVTREDPKNCLKIVGRLQEHHVVKQFPENLRLLSNIFVIQLFHFNHTNREPTLAEAHTKWSRKVVDKNEYLQKNSKKVETEK